MPDLHIDSSFNIPQREEIPPEHWIMRHDGLPIRVPNEGIMVTGLNTQRGIGQVMWPKIRDAFPPIWHQEKRVGTNMGPNQCPIVITLPNGSKIFTGSADQSPRQFEGFNSDWAWIDEPVPQWIFAGIWRALVDFEGALWMTMTPVPDAPQWMEEWLDDDEVWSYQGESYDNVYLRKQALDSFFKAGDFTESELKARKAGQFARRKRVYEGLDPEVHFIEPFQIPSDWIIGQTVDPHHKKAAFVIWWALDPATEPDWVFHFFREWPNEDYFSMEGGALAPADYAILFRNLERNRPATIRICDPRFGKADWRPAGMPTRTVWIEEMAKAGLSYDANIHGVNLLEIGHTRVSNMLSYDRGYPIGPTNTPKMFFWNTCPNTQKAMKKYAYVEVRDPDKGSKEVPSEEFKDPCDCVRYTALYNMPGYNYVAQVGEQFNDQALEEWDE